jgi:hypothetical protein
MGGHVFLPMLPLHILLNNCLSDLPQVPIPSGPITPLPPLFFGVLVVMIVTYLPSWKS